MFSAEPEPAEGRRVNRARDGPAFLYQSNVNREFSVAGDKFFRSVQWIDQQKPVSDRSRLPRRRRLLSDDWSRRNSVSQLGANDRFRALVGDSDWTAVAFGPNVSAVFINLHHRRSGGDGSVGKEDSNLVCVSEIEIEVMPVRIKLAQRRFLSLEADRGEPADMRRFLKMSPPTHESDTQRKELESTPAMLPPPQNGH